MNINTPPTTEKTVKETLPDSEKASENQITCSSAEEHLVENENRKKVRLATVEGLKDEKKII